MSPRPRRGRPVPKLLPIYDPSLARDSPERVLHAWAAAGAEWFQYRDKVADDRRFWAAASEVHRVAGELDLYPMINDRVHVAAALGGTGVHVGQADLPVAPTRRLVGREWIGLSVDDPEGARRGETAGADYVAVGPVFGTGSKADAGDAVGLDLVRRVVAAVSVPVVAIGGIDAARAGDVLGAGADCVSMLSAVLDVDDPGKAARRLLDAAGAGDGEVPRGRSPGER